MTILQCLAGQSCGCEGRGTLKAATGIDAALALIAGRTDAVAETQTIPSGRALGHMPASPVASLCVCPPFDTAAMDGCEIASAMLRGDGPWTLDVLARVPAGQSTPGPQSGLQAARIPAGASIPEGTDAVVMQEDVAQTGSAIRIARRPKTGLNVRRTGGKRAAGVVVPEQGRRRCLPGNPLPAFVTWQPFATAVIHGLTGDAGQGAKQRHVATVTAVSRKAGRRELRPAICAGFEGQGCEVVTLEAETLSSHVLSLPDADDLILLPADCDGLPAGARIDFQPFCQT